MCYSSSDNEDRVFFPDYIVKLTSGKFLIVDTKMGNIDINESKKREALLAALVGHHRVIGGIVKQEREHFYIHGSDNTIKSIHDML